MAATAATVPTLMLFKEAFPPITYHMGNAKRRFLQMPVVTIIISNVFSSKAEWYVMELIHGVDYVKLSHFFIEQAPKF